MRCVLLVYRDILPVSQKIPAVLKTASPTRHYPFKGHVYLVTSPSLQARGHLKYGLTTRTVEERTGEHGGQLLAEKSTPLFSMESLDAARAETLARALFRQNGWHADGSKEFVTCTAEQAIEVLKQSVAKAQVRSTPLLVPASPDKQVEVTLAEGSAAWETLLALSLRIGTDAKEIGQWLASSLTDAGLSRKLAQRGFQCVNWCRKRPVFQLTAMPEQLELSFRSLGLQPESLISEEFGCAQAELSID